MSIPPEVIGTFPKWINDANTEIVSLYTEEWLNAWNSMHNSDTGAAYVVVDPFYPLQLTISCIGGSTDMEIKRYTLVDADGGTLVWTGAANASQFGQLQYNFAGAPTWSANNYVNVKTSNPMHLLGVITA